MAVGVNIGFLICRECKGYYQLGEEEHPDDFESCQCGGELVYTPHFDSLSEAVICVDMDEKLQEKLNEIMDLEYYMQNKAKPYRVNTQKKKNVLNRLFESFNRWQK